MNPNRNNTSATYPNAPEPWFTAKVTDVGGSSPVPYEFVEVWLDETGVPVEMFGGRANDIASDPAHAVAGGPFAVDDIVLVRSARGAAGLLWEVIAADGGGTSDASLLLVEVTVSGTSHTVKQKTWAGGAIADYAGPVTFTGVRSTTGGTLPVGTLGYLNPIPDVSGEYWMSPNAGYASVTLPGLVSIDAQTFNGDKTFDDHVVVNDSAGTGARVPHTVYYKRAGVKTAAIEVEQFGAAAAETTKVFINAGAGTYTQADGLFITGDVYIGKEGDPVTFDLFPNLVLGSGAYSGQTVCGIQMTSGSIIYGGVSTGMYVPGSITAGLHYVEVGTDLFQGRNNTNTTNVIGQILRGGIYCGFPNNTVIGSPTVTDAGLPGSDGTYTLQAVVSGGGTAVALSWV